MHNSMIIFTFFSFQLELHFLGKFGPKDQYCLLKLTFVTKINLNMQNSMKEFSFCFIPEIPFSVNEEKRSKGTVSRRSRVETLK